MEHSQSSTSGDALKIDWKHLHEFSEEDSDFETELLSLLAQDTRMQIQALRHAISNDDRAYLQETAHYIKGAAANMGVTGLAAIAQQLETIELDDTINVNQTVDQMETVLQSLENLVSERQA